MTPGGDEAKDVARAAGGPRIAASVARRISYNFNRPSILITRSVTWRAVKEISGTATALGLFAVLQLLLKSRQQLAVFQSQRVPIRRLPFEPVLVVDLTARSIARVTCSRAAARHQVLVRK